MTGCGRKTGLRPSPVDREGPRRNAEEANRVLSEQGIAVVAEETGGSVGRNVRFDLVTGICSVETRL